MSDSIDWAPGPDSPYQRNDPCTIRARELEREGRSGLAQWYRNERWQDWKDGLGSRWAFLP